MTTPRPSATARRPAPSPHGRNSRAGTDLLFYEGLHGAVVTDNVNIARYADLRIGVVPVINLEWIQKIHRDKEDARILHRGDHGHDPAAHAGLVKYICPQFSETDINFQRVPTVDTSNPFIARWIPTPDESMVVIRFENPRGIDFPYLLSMIHDSFMSRANSIVIPGGKLDLAMQLILTPMILQLVEAQAADQGRKIAQPDAKVSESAPHPEMANAIRALAMDAVEQANAPGAYRVTVSGEEVEQAEDAFAVLEAEGG